MTLELDSNTTTTNSTTTTTNSHASLVPAAPDLDDHIGHLRNLQQQSQHQPAMDLPHEGGAATGGASTATAGTSTATATTANATTANATTVNATTARAITAETSTGEVNRGLDDRQKNNIPDSDSPDEADDDDVLNQDNDEEEDDDEDDDDDDDDDDLLLDYLNAIEDDNSSSSTTTTTTTATKLPPDTFSPQEAKALRLRLRQVGPSEFVRETITAGSVSAKKLVTAFGVAPPVFLAGRPDEAYYRLLGLLIARECSTRKKLAQFNTLRDAAELLRTRRHVLVITGAGISTNLGVPDFRSTKTGFYARMRDEHGFDRPEEIFDIDRFEEDPSVFFKFSADTLPAPGKSSPTHAFIKLLDDRGTLLTNYTQNIDNVEGNVGISPAKLIQCHGSWATFTCRRCGHRAPGQQFYELVKRQQIPRCGVCPSASLAVPRPALKRKRSSKSSHPSRGSPWRGGGDFSDDDDDDGRYDIQEPGIMKPDITFFGEKLPDTFFDRFKHHDRDRADLVLVIGTSMTVAPVSEIPMALPEDVPHIYISRAPVRHMEFDVTLLGDCDVVVSELARLAGWDLRHPMLDAHAGDDVVVEQPDEEQRQQGIWIVRRRSEVAQDQPTTTATISTTTATISTTTATISTPMPPVASVVVDRVDLT